MFLLDFLCLLCSEIFHNIASYPRKGRKVLFAPKFCPHHIFSNCKNQTQEDAVTELVCIFLHLCNFGWIVLTWGCFSCGWATETSVNTRHHKQRQRGNRQKRWAWRKSMTSQSKLPSWDTDPLYGLGKLIPPFFPLPDSNDIREHRRIKKVIVQRQQKMLKGLKGLKRRYWTIDSSQLSTLNS